MANKMILGASGFDKLALGYETNTSQIKTRPFTVAATEKDGIVPGDLLVVTEQTQVYKKASATTDVIAGIAIATNVKVDTMFPQSEGEVAFKAGEKASALIYGEIAVKLYGTAPKEGDAVYYDLTNKAFTKTAEGALKVPGARFSGVTEGDVTVVFVQYI